MTLLMTVIVYCCWIKCQTKRKYLLTFDDASVKEIDVKNIL